MPSHLKRYQTFGHDHFITFTCYHRLPFLDNDIARFTFLEILEKLRSRHQFYVFGAGGPIISQPTTERVPRS